MCLAKVCHATLVVIALLHVKAKRGRPEPRLEYIMQAKDFLEAVRWKAARHGVPVECFEVITADVIQSLDVLIRQFSCNGVALFVRKGRGVLLSHDEIVGCLEHVACTAYLVHLQTQTNSLLNSVHRWLSWCSSWLTRRLFSPDGETIPPSLESSASMICDDSRPKEGCTEDVTEDQRIHSNG